MKHYCSRCGNELTEEESTGDICNKCFHKFIEKEHRMSKR